MTRRQLLAAESGSRDLVRDLKRRMVALMKELEDPATPAVEAWEV